MAPAVNETMGLQSMSSLGKALGKLKKSIKKESSVVINDVGDMKLQKEAKTIVATESRDAAIRDCRRKVQKISRECRLDNVKYRDPHFDLAENPAFCLNGLRQTGEGTAGVNEPSAIKRVGQIYDKPQFIVDGIDAGDIKQGSAGDCWFLAAVATIANMPNLLESICVARDEEVGVYGFIFFRDGEWISEVIDDQLYITHGDYVTASAEMKAAFPTEALYVQAKQRGSSALHYAKCGDSNETWLPLLEKAFAKAHGDYTAIEGGFTGEGVEDLTGGVTVEVITRDILSRDRFWNEELTKVNKELLFACGITSDAPEVNGILTGHAYSVLKAVEAKGQRLVQVRNPWGQTEWTGAWSDGSSEWTAEWMTALGHKFGDDGAFWMSYDDFLNTFTDLDRTRIFTPEWTVAQCWTRQQVVWPAHFAGEEFRITLQKAGPVVLALQQADTRYFVGLDGQYCFELHFRLRREGESEYLVRSKQSLVMTRSASKEVNLEAGSYIVSFRIARLKNGHPTRTAYIGAFIKDQSNKFMHISKSYDYAVAKTLTFEAQEEEPEAEEEEQEEEEQAEAEEQAAETEEQAEEQAEAEEEDPEEEDSVAIIGLRVHAKDPELQVELVEADETNQELDPDASCVHQFLHDVADKSAFLSSALGAP